jgi:hypothetical protein
VLQQLRVTVPSDRTAREAAFGLVAGLRDRDGGIAMVMVDAATSRAAREAEERAPGEGADAVVWEQVVRTTDADSTLSVSYLAFLTIATLLAAVAIVNDSAILVIGAMVLGPEFAPLAGLAVAVVHERRRIARNAAIALVAGFAVAIGLTAVAALVGVFISVTTVPAAADMGLSLALGGSAEFVRASTQLGINLAGILVAATATLALQKALWRRVPRVAPAMERMRPAGMRV